MRVASFRKGPRNARELSSVPVGSSSRVSLEWAFIQATSTAPIKGTRTLNQQTPLSDLVFPLLNGEKKSSRSSQHNFALRENGFSRGRFAQDVNVTIAINAANNLNVIYGSDLSAQHEH